MGKIGKPQIIKMTIAQIVLIIYLCCFVCCIGGLWLIGLETVKTLRKMGHKKIYNTAPFDLYSILLCMCPILNVLVALFIMRYWDNILEITIKRLTEGEKQ